MTPKTEAFISDGGARIYRMPIQLFPELWGHVHLVAADGVVALVDVGSGFGESNDHLEFGLEAVRRDHGEAIEWRDLIHVLITHGHIDHFDGRVLTRYDERLATIGYWPWKKLEPTLST